jgi:hypothetical protein
MIEQNIFSVLFAVQFLRLMRLSYFILVRGAKWLHCLKYCDFGDPRCYHGPFCYITAVNFQMQIVNGRYHYPELLNFKHKKVSIQFLSYKNTYVRFGIEVSWLFGQVKKKAT